MEDIQTQEDRQQQKKRRHAAEEKRRRDKMRREDPQKYEEWKACIRRYNETHKEQNKVRDAAYHAANREKRIAACKEWHRKHPSKSREYMLKSKYGLTLEEYDKLLEHQGGLCAICEKVPRGRGGLAPVDHDHETGDIRGILCSNCNHMLGHAKDDPGILRAGAAYLEARRLSPEPLVVEMGPGEEIGEDDDLLLPVPQVEDQEGLNRILDSRPSSSSPCPGEVLVSGLPIHGPAGR